MLVITATPITEEDAHSQNISCELIDYVSIKAAEFMQSDTFDRCSLVPVWAVTLRPAEDMLIPVFLCPIHFGAFKLSLHEGVGVDEDVFGEFPKEN
jgi:hypothetical protein